MNKQSGFTMIEVLVSLGLFGIITSGVTSVFINHLKFDSVAGQRTGAINAAEQQLDNLRKDDPTAMPTTGSTTSTSTIGGRAFSVVTKYCTNATYCATTSQRHIKVEVSFRGTLLYAVETVYTKLR
jgi:prepilin-type N-terminal cleavage/methylation domain-containing protein